MEAPAREVGRDPPLDFPGNTIYLEKQDKLFDLNLDINAQVVLLSQAPTSKTAFLGNLTGIPDAFFEATTTLTVQIVFRRIFPNKLTTLSIVPWQDNEDTVKESLKTLYYAADGVPGDDLVQEATSAHNRISAARQLRSHRKTSGDDVLRREISGPECPHFSILSLPTLSRWYPLVVSPEEHSLSLLDEDADQVYIRNLLRLVKQHDPSMERTIFIPTSPNPCREDDGHVRDLVLLKSANLKLSSSCDILLSPWWDTNIPNDIPDLDSFHEIKHEAALVNPKRVDFLERAFTGVGPLRSRLARLLCNLAAEETPKQTTASTHEYRCKLITIASEFQRIVHEALENRDYPSILVKENPEQSLVQQISDLNLGFSALMWRKGHTSDFETKLDSVNDGFTQTKPIAETIEKCYKDSRKAELGTLPNPPIMLALFQAQTTKWPTMATAHIGTAVTVIHDFIKAVLDHVVSDKTLRDNIWQQSLMCDLPKLYKYSLNVTKALLRVERNLRPSTYTPDYAKRMSTLQASRDNNIRNRREAATTAEWAKEAIEFGLRSYYQVSIKRFVDAICRQAVEDGLLFGTKSPLKVLTPETVMAMSEPSIFGDHTPPLEKKKKKLEDELARWEAAAKILADE
ncbi:hypothetical protein QBC34DRAFT_479213 [Podospora aff. communis PSN243]|uniref:GED domain-containing protein n=1 Tax=Podospora aff. communis PSN243 TaxID=3040156 RepID=A0AAV9G2L9_9PEZI|nr:hypothetical protein QBC34DRAFT_479213 [Podospora aff. communis PSN243]